MAAGELDARRQGVANQLQQDVLHAAAQQVQGRVCLLPTLLRSGQHVGGHLGITYTSRSLPDNTTG